MNENSFHAPAIVFGPRWSVPFVPVRDQVLAAAAAHGERIAVEDDNGSITYAELEHQSRVIGSWLRTHTPIDDQRTKLVAVVGGRSPALIPALLGVWRAGAAYLPIDAGYPIDRVRLLIDDAGPSAVLIDETTTTASLVAELLHHDNAALLGDILGAGAEVDSYEDVELLPDDLAYLIYTSGSTGKPKGACIAQRNIVNFLAGHAHDAGLTYLDRQGWAGSVSFDASVSDIWPPLVVGAALCLAPPGVPANLRALNEWLHSERITSTLIGSAIVNMLFGMEDSWWEGLSLRVLFTGGDRLTRRPPAGLPFVFVNAYGPTECTVWATIAHPQVVARDGEDLAPSIGTPIANSFIVILDENLRPCSVGQQGEICIGGSGVGLGYLGRPDVTREHFIADVYSSPSGGSHLYRTGDQGMLQPDGEIRFIGRSDRQIALHGFRIEAGEVEAGILESPEVKQAVVKRCDFEGLGPRVVAFITWRDPSQNTTVDHVRENMAVRLPGYMIPNQFVVLNEMPMTPNGKVDESKLIPPRRERADFAGEYRAPETESQTKLCRIFTDVLALDRVGVDDDFFELGGDSLAGVEAMTAVEEQFHIELGSGTVQEHPTPRSFAAYLEGGQVDAAELDLAAEAVQPALAVTKRPVEPAQRSVLITGASGFIGSQVAKAVLASAPDVNVRAVCRSTEQIDALRASLGDAGVRLHGLVGDLTQPQLGLSPSEWAELTVVLTAIVHAGAAVNHVKPYAALRNANVVATSQIAQLAADAGGIPVVYLSSDSASSGTDGMPPNNGYAQTKWVSEQRLRAAAEDGIPVRIVRLERVLPDDAGLVVNPSDTVTVLSLAALACGVIPDFGVAEPATPVDVAAAAIAGLCFETSGGALLLYPPMAVYPWSEIVESVGRNAAVSVVTWPAWLDALKARNTVETQRALALTRLYSEAEIVGDARASVAAAIPSLQPQIDTGWHGFAPGYTDRFVAALRAT